MIRETAEEPSLLATVSLLRAGALQGFRPLARELGLDPDALLRAVGLRPAGLDDPDQRLAYAAVALLLEETARRSGVADVGLRLAAAHRLDFLGVIGVLARQAPDVGSALREIIGHLHLHNEHETWHLETRGSVCRVERWGRESLGLADVQMREMAVLDAARVVEALLGEQFTCRAVCLRHAPLAPIACYEAAFGMRPQFEAAFDGLEFDAALLAEQIAERDVAVVRELERLLARLEARHGEDLAARVRVLIRQALRAGYTDIDTVAGLLALHKRTLQNRLREQGTSFRELLAEERWGQVQDDLAAADLPIVEIALRAGYSEAAAFNRAFRARFDTTPGRWRRRARTG